MSNNIVTCRDCSQQYDITKDEHTHRIVGSKRKIICLCGSTKFKQEYESINWVLTMQGCIVLSVGCFRNDDDLNISNSLKENLDELHLDKIRLADEVYVINVDGYIGESTEKEIEFATKLGKKITYLMPLSREYLIKQLIKKISKLTREFIDDSKGSLDSNSALHVGLALNFAKDVSQIQNELDALKNQ